MSDIFATSESPFPATSSEAQLSRVQQSSSPSGSIPQALTLADVIPFQVPTEPDVFVTPELTDRNQQTRSPSRNHMQHPLAGPSITSAHHRQKKEGQSVEVPPPAYERHALPATLSEAESSSKVFPSILEKSSQSEQQIADLAAPQVVTDFQQMTLDIEAPTEVCRPDLAPNVLGMHPGLVRPVAASLASTLIPTAINALGYGIAKISWHSKGPLDCPIDSRFLATGLYGGLVGGAVGFFCRPHFDRKKNHIELSETASIALSIMGQVIMNSVALIDVSESATRSLMNGNVNWLEGGEEAYATCRARFVMSSTPVAAGALFAVLGVLGGLCFFFLPEDEATAASSASRSDGYTQITNQASASHS